MKFQLLVVATCLIFTAFLATISIADLSDNLVGYWPLDGDASDSGGNGLDGTINGNVVPSEDRFGISDGSMKFPGNMNDYIDIGSPPQLQITGAMTLAAWARIDDFETNGRIVAKQLGGANKCWSLNVESEKYGHVGAFHIAVDGNNLILGTTADRIDFSPDEWFHIAGVYDPGNSVSIYINGELDNSITEDIPDTQFNNNANVNIGRRQDCCPMNGSIDDVIIWSRALSPNEIVQAMGEGGPFAAAVEPAGKLTTTWGEIKY
jgi:hypothetical protein